MADPVPRVEFLRARGVTIRDMRGPGGACAICFDGSREVADCMPCGHLGVCRPCWREIYDRRGPDGRPIPPRCPWCRARPAVPYVPAWFDGDGPDDVFLPADGETPWRASIALHLRTEGHDGAAGLELLERVSDVFIRWARDLYTGAGLPEGRPLSAYIRGARALSTDGPPSWAAVDEYEAAGRVESLREAGEGVAGLLLIAEEYTAHAFGHEEADGGLDLRDALRADPDPRAAMAADSLEQLQAAADRWDGDFGGELRAYYGGNMGDGLGPIRDFPERVRAWCRETFGARDI